MSSAGIKCDECGYMFDHNDSRGLVSEENNICPVCVMSNLQGLEAWAVWNECNGVFPNTVKHSKADALELLPDFEAAGASVVPVRVYVDSNRALDIRVPGEES